MRCKPGDLAVIVDSAREENIGIVVKVIEFSALTRVGDVSYECGHLWQASATGLTWIVESQGRPILGSHTGMPFMVRPYGDEYLRPIRDSDGQDETLTWAPKNVTA